MCYGIVLNNGQYCPHEIRSGENAGECGKRGNAICLADANYCDVCDTWYAEDGKCDCEGCEGEDDE